jgi:predicted transcriptional regulator
MKTSTLPAIRVKPELREAAERALRPNETLSKLMESSLESFISQRAAEDEFISRGLRAAETARQTNQYVSAKDVLMQLDERIAAAKRK